MFNKIFVPIDLNDEPSWKLALPRALKLAKEDNAELLLFNVVPDFGMAMVGSFFPKDYAQKAIEHAEYELKAVARNHVPADQKVTCYVRHGSIYKEINKIADKLGADLIVISSYQPNSTDIVLGPNAARVVRYARQSVFVVRN